MRQVDIAIYRNVEKTIFPFEMANSTTKILYYQIHCNNRNLNNMKYLMKEIDNTRWNFYIRKYVTNLKIVRDLSASTICRRQLRTMMLLSLTFSQWSSSQWSQLRSADVADDGVWYLLKDLIQFWKLVYLFRDVEVSFCVFMKFSVSNVKFLFCIVGVVVWNVNVCVLSMWIQYNYYYGFLCESNEIISCYYLNRV